MIYENYRIESLWSNGFTDYCLKTLNAWHAAQSLFITNFENAAELFHRILAAGALEMRDVTDNLIMLAVQFK